MTRLIVTGLLVVITFAMSLDMHAAATTGTPLGTPEPVEACPPWRMAGAQMIFKCDDPDAMVTCYQPAGGVLQCVPYQ